jgi:two-component system response regulator YesN
MNEYSCVIIDDEDIAIERLEYMLQIYFPTINIIGKFNNSSAAIDICMAQNPDIIFSDIKMPGMNGLDFFEKIVTSNCNSQVIIISAYSQSDYLLRGIQLGLVGYLVKPYSKEELQDVIQKAIEKIELKLHANILENLVRVYKPKDKVPLKTMREIIYEAPENIVAIVAQKKICQLYTIENQKVDINYLLKELENKLNYKFLIRVDKSHIINIHHVASIDVKNQLCILKNLYGNIQLTLSEVGIKELKRFLLS